MIRNFRKLIRKIAAIIIIILFLITGNLKVFAGNNIRNDNISKPRLSLSADTNLMIQSVTFNIVSPVIFGKSDYDPGAKASSGLPVAYSSSDTNVVSIVNNLVHILKIGSSVITAVQKGTDTILPASASQTLVINRANLFVIGKSDTIDCGRQINLDSSNISYLGFAYNDNASVLQSKIKVSTTATKVMGKFPIKVSGENSDGNYNLSYINGVLYIRSIGPENFYTQICKGDSFQLSDGREIKIPGLYTDTFTIFQGCDSLVSYNINVISSENINLNITKCTGDSMKIGNVFIKENGIYKDTVYSLIAGCDSLDRVINLKFENKPSVNAGLDQIICSGDSIRLIARGTGDIWWQGYSDTSILVKPTSTTIYTAISTNSCGTVYDNATVVVNVNPGKPNIFVNGNTLTTDANTSLYSVQWYIGSNIVIPNATNWKYMPTESGDYFVKVKNGVCTVSSETIHYSFASILNEEISETIKFYPNPIEDELQVSYNSGISKIEVYNTIGNLIVRKLFNSEKNAIINANEWKPGVYMIKLWPANSSLSPTVETIIKK